MFRSEAVPGFWIDSAWLFADELPDDLECLNRILGSYLVPYWERRRPACILAASSRRRIRAEGASTLPTPRERRAVDLVVRWIHSTLVPPGKSRRGSVPKQVVERPDTIGDIDLPAVVGVEAGRRLTSGEVSGSAG